MAGLTCEEERKIYQSAGSRNEQERNARIERRPYFFNLLRKPWIPSPDSTILLYAFSALESTNSSPPHPCIGRPSVSKRFSFLPSKPADSYVAVSRSLSRIPAQEIQNWKSVSHVLEIKSLYLIQTRPLPVNKYQQQKKKQTKKQKKTEINLSTFVRISKKCGVKGYKGRQKRTPKLRRIGNLGNLTHNILIKICLYWKPGTVNRVCITEEHGGVGVNFT